MQYPKRMWQSLQQYLQTDNIFIARRMPSYAKRYCLAIIMSAVHRRRPTKGVNTRTMYHTHIKLFVLQTYNT